MSGPAREPSARAACAPAAPGVERFEGCLLGLMAGDCIGLSREGLPPERARSLFGAGLRHNLIFGRGMASDDTELACFTAQAFLASPGDSSGFARALGWKLRLWLLGVPAGVGFATLRAALKLWLGFSALESGVRSAGNGAAIRSPVIGLACWDDDGKLREFTGRSTRMTHTDPRAERGALALALAARYAAVHRPEDFSRDELLGQLVPVFPDDDLEARRWLAALRADSPGFIAALGCESGVTGYVYHTVPAVLWAWLAAPFDFRGGMERIVALGGDTDTTGATFGALCGAAAGEKAIPPEWLAGICERPRSVAWVRELARRLHAAAVDKKGCGPLALAWPLIPVRNALFLSIVLAHGLRRLLPPYR